MMLDICLLSFPKVMAHLSTALSYYEEIHKCANNADARLAAYKNFFAEPSLIGSSSWLALALQGVQDVWSVIRKHSVSSLAHQLRSESLFVSFDNKPSLSLRFMHLVQLSKAAKKSWFCADGLLLLMKELTKAVGGRVETNKVRLCDFALSDGERVQLASTHILDLVVHEQLQVRTSAIEVIVLLCEEPEINQVILSLMPPKFREGLTLGSTVSKLEGLLELIIFFPTTHADVILAQRSQGLPLAAHGAATVRQRFGDFIAKAHGGDVGATIDLLFPLLRDEATIDSQWMQIETLLMALSEQLTALFNDNARELFLPKRAETLYAPESFFVDLLRASSSTTFEVRRMSVQVLPLYCQYIVHLEPPRLIVPLLTNELLKPVRERLCWFLMLRRVVATFLQCSPPYTISAKAVVGEIDAALAFHLSNESTIISPLVRIMLACYGPRSFRRLATQADWRDVLQGSQESLIASRYAPDFAILSPVSVFVVELWINNIVDDAAPPHVQLLLLEASRVLVAPRNAQHGLLLFTSREDFRPPSILDGGDDVPEGFTWTRGMLSSLPKRSKVYECNIVSDNSATDDTAVTAIDDRSLGASIGAVNPEQVSSFPLHVRVFYPLFDTLLIKKNVEPRVIVVLFAILADFYQRRAVTLALLLHWVVARLDGLYGRESWTREAALAAASKDGSKKPSSNSFDDSDDEGSESESVAGGNAAIEIKRVKDFLANVYGYNLVNRDAWATAISLELPTCSGCLGL